MKLSNKYLEKIKTFVKYYGEEETEDTFVYRDNYYVCKYHTDTNDVILQTKTDSGLYDILLHNEVCEDDLRLKFFLKEVLEKYDEIELEYKI